MKGVLIPDLACICLDALFHALLVIQNILENARIPHPNDVSRSCRADCFFCS